MRRLGIVVYVFATAFIMKPVLADLLGEEALAKLVDDKTWHLNWAACMGGADGCWTYWDWSSDGSVCARAIDAKKDDKCADNGKWRIEGEKLCWELEWLGGGEGYKSVCVLTSETSPGRYEATRVGGLGLPFFTFSVAE